MQMCHMLDQEAKSAGASTAVMKCCTDAEKELKAAATEHEQLMKVLGIVPLKK